MATVTQQSIANTLEQLHKSTSDNTGAIDETGGLYTLINNMISNLSSIKASIKAEEKKMINDLGNITTIAGATVLTSPTVSAASHAANATATRVCSRQYCRYSNNVAVFQVQSPLLLNIVKGQRECYKTGQTIVDLKKIINGSNHWRIWYMLHYKQ